MNPTKIKNFDTFEFGLSFDDVLLRPNYSEFLPNSVVARIANPIMKSPRTPNTLYKNGVAEK